MLVSSRHESESSRCKKHAAERTERASGARAFAWRLRLRGACRIVRVQRAEARFPFAANGDV
jgi:hypothetical protein